MLQYEDITVLEDVQDGESSQEQDLRGMSEVTWLVHLGEEKAEGDLIITYNFCSGGSGEGGAAFLSLVTCDGARGNGMKLCEGKFRLDMRKRFFTEKVVGHWSQLPREVDVAPNLSELKKYLDDALSHMVSFQVVL